MSTRLRRLPQGSNSRVPRKATSASMKIITSGPRPASARPNSMANTSWSMRPPTSSSRIRSRRAISEATGALALAPPTLPGADLTVHAAKFSRRDSYRGAGLLDHGGRIDVRRLFDWRSRRDFRDAGFRGTDPVFGLRADGARSRHHIRPDGRHQHGAWRVSDPRRLRYLDDLQSIPRLPAGLVCRLFLPRNDIGVCRVRSPRNAGRMGFDPASLQASAGYAACDLGPQPDPATGLSLDLRCARGRRRIAGMDAGIVAGHRRHPDSDQRHVRDVPDFSDHAWRGLYHV